MGLFCSVEFEGVLGYQMLRVPKLCPKTEPAMRKLLSALAVPKLGTGEYWDPLIPGLALRVGTRRRTWTFRHRVGGRHRRDILGSFPSLSLADARSAAGKLLERMEAGAAPVPAPVHPRSALTLGTLI